MREQTNFEVVVGVDGTGSSLYAVKWAAAEASSRGGTLRLVHVMAPVTLVPVRSGADHGEDQAADEAAVRLLEVAALVATTVSPGLEVRTDLLAGSPAHLLCDASRDADLLVLGDRAPGGCTGTLVGAVAATVADLATCPVLVVRGRVTHSGPVVVGLDGSAQDASVLAAAFDRAERAKTSMLAIHAFHVLPRQREDAQAQQSDPVQSALDVLSNALAPFVTSHPSVSVETNVMVCAPSSSPTAALISASAGAQLLVVGAASPNAALRGLVAASACCDDRRHAHCPVELVRPAA
jgi:nucleotide-binding universal stress UspA family protein